MNSASAGPTLDAKTLEILSRQFNLAFSNSCTYAPDHPATAKSAAEFCASVGKLPAAVLMVTMLLDRDSLYCEEMRLDTKMNVRRVIAAFKKAGIQSVSFERGISGTSVQNLITVLLEPGANGSVDTVQRALHGRNASHIRINYVTIRKVTADESIVDKTATQAPSPRAAALHPAPVRPAQTASPTSARDDRALKQLGGILSVGGMLRDPGLAAQRLVQATGGAASERAEVLAHLRDLNNRVASDAGDPHALSPDELAEAVFKLKSDLREGLEVQKTLGKIAEDEGAVLSEVDKLSYQVIVNLAREEFRAGSVSTKRLAQLIRRMLPDVKELRRLLPMLKEGLLAQGMSLADFLDLARELRMELKSDGLAQALEQGAEELGLGVEEIARGIRDNPGEAARLIVLASEIRQGSQQDEKQLSQLLTDYVDQISSHVVSTTAQSVTPEGAKAMEKMVGELEGQLMARLRAHGLADGLLRTVGDELSKRLPGTVTRARTDWLSGLMKSRTDLSGADLVHLLGSLVEHEADLSALENPLHAALTEKGYPSDKIREEYDKIAARLHVRDTMTPSELPRNVFDVNNTVFFLKREIGLFLRYHNCFSTLVLTIVAVRDEAAWRIPNAAEATAVFSKVYGILGELLRDLDLVGSMGALARSIPFVIMPMTPESGAFIVKKRLEDRLSAETFASGTTALAVSLAISTTSIEGSSATDLKSYIDIVKQRHAARELELRQSTAGA